MAVYFGYTMPKKAKQTKSDFFYHQRVKIQLSGLQMSPIPSLGLDSKAGKSIFRTRGMHGFERRINVFFSVRVVGNASRIMTRLVPVQLSL